MVTKGYYGTSLRDILTDYDPDQDIPNDPYNPPSDPPINDYLFPIGDSGFWITPSEPADPLDCRRYPDSPWCGGSGIDPWSVAERKPIDIEPGISRNECETCLSFDLSLFFIAFPQNMICYRSKRPECQPPAEPPPPPPTPPPGGKDPVFTPYNGPRLSGCAHRVFISALIAVPGSRPTRYVTFETVSNFYFDTTPNGVWSYTAANGAVGDGFATKFTVSGADDDIGVTWGNAGSADGPFQITRIEPPPNPQACKPYEEPKAPPKRPPPPLERRCRCMACCAPNDNDDNNELLRIIALRLGAFSYPVQTPKWLVTNQGESSVKHQSLTDFTMWIVQQLDALAGEFPIKIEIEDADPVKEGNQSKTVSLPNIAESLAEIYGLTAKNAIDGDIHTNFLTRLATEVMATKVAALVAQDYASANASFLGYRGNQVARDVSFAFDPEDNASIEALLKGGAMQYRGWKNEDRDNARAYLERLMFSAGIIKAVFFRSKRDVNRVLNDMKAFNNGPGGAQDEDWREFLQMLNNPTSDINRSSPAKPDVDRL